MSLTIIDTNGNDNNNQENRTLIRKLDLHLLPLLSYVFSAKEKHEIKLFSLSQCYLFVILSRQIEYC